MNNRARPYCYVVEMKIISFTIISFFVILLAIKIIVPKANRYFQIREAEHFSKRLEEINIPTRLDIFSPRFQSTTIKAQITTSKADRYMNQGTAYTAKRHHHAAIFCYNRAMEVEPNNASPYVKRAKTYMYMDKLDEAILDFNQAIEIDPYKTEAYRLRGSIYMQRGNMDQGIHDCTKAIESESLLLERNKQRQTDNDYFDPDVFLESLPDIEFPDLDASDSYWLRGTAYEHRGEFAKALSDYSKAIEIGLYFKLVKYYKSRLQLYYRMQEYDKSLEDTLKAKSLGAEVEPGFLEELRKNSRHK